MLTVLTGKVSLLTVIYKRYANIPSSFLLAQHHMGGTLHSEKGLWGLKRANTFPSYPRTFV